MTPGRGTMARAMIQAILKERPRPPHRITFQWDDMLQFHKNGQDGIIKVAIDAARECEREPKVTRDGHLQFKSKCCGAQIVVAGEGRSMYKECFVCGQPCDVKEGLNPIEDAEFWSKVE